MSCACRTKARNALGLPVACKTGQRIESLGATQVFRRVEELNRALTACFLRSSAIYSALALDFQGRRDKPSSDRALPLEPGSKSDGGTPSSSQSHSWFAEAAVLVRSNRTFVLLFSVVLLVPCFWQSRIQAGDLSSHLYNAWLALLIGQGHAPGLWIANQWTNVSFDVALSWLLAAFGVRAAERIAVSAAVLVFFWGAFALAWTVSRWPPWVITPCLAMLTYGWVFRIGFFNFYLSVGLSLFFLAVVWGGTPWDRMSALPALLLAWLAHPLPVAWVLAAAVYVFISRRLSVRAQIGLLVVSLGGLLAVRWFLSEHHFIRWSLQQVLFVTGADQVAILGRKEWLVALLLLLLWGAVLLLQNGDRASTRLGIPSQLCLLSAACVFLLPGSIRFSSSQSEFTLITDRLSFFSGILACVLVGTLKPKRWHGLAFALVAIVYFWFLYVDTLAINRIETKAESLVAQLPPEQRVLFFVPWRGPTAADSRAVHGIEAKLESWVSESSLGRRVLAVLPRSRINLPLAHVIDRVCIGHCFSYANYEPSSGHFRIRALPGNPIIAWQEKDSLRMQRGTYVVRQSDLPVYQIYQCGQDSGELCIRPLKAGEVNGANPAPTEKE